MENFDGWNHRDARSGYSGAEVADEGIVFGLVGGKTPPPRRRPTWNDAGAGWRCGEFYKSLSPQAMSEFESHAAPYCCEGNTELFAEGKESLSILFLLEGTVTVTMNLIDGRRLTLRIAMPGEVLGLVGALSGCLCEITAVALSPCLITSLPRQDFVDFLLRHPVACQNSARLLSAEHERCREQFCHFGSD
jgi:hypothetical protein